VQTLLYQADLKWPVGGMLAASGLCFLVPLYLVYERFDSILVALPIGLLVGATPFFWAFHKRRKRLDQFQQGLPEALDLTVSALRADTVSSPAIGSVARECADPIGCEFQGVLRGAELWPGDEDRHGQHAQPRSPPGSPHCRTAIMIQKESGGNLAEFRQDLSCDPRAVSPQAAGFGPHSAGADDRWVLTLLPVVLES